MTLVVGALTIGLILSVLALGVFITFRLFAFADITAEGSLTLGAASASVLLVSGVNPLVACGAALLCGAAAGAVTAVIHTRFNVNRLLAGILVMTALYSVNLRIMGRSNVPLVSETTLASLAERAGARLAGSAGPVHIWGWEVALRDVSMLGLALVIAVGTATLLCLFFRTNLGMAMQAAGDSPEMTRAVGVNVDLMLVCGLALSNALIAFAGAVLAQYQGFADAQMGIGMMVWGLASVIIGEGLVGGKPFGFLVAGAVMGSVLFRLLVAIALRGGLNPNDLKLVTAGFVLVALMLPQSLQRVAGWRRAWNRSLGAPGISGGEPR
jgi:putative tryptophan/tyrosine transport system permease protein